jgi:hypothetical protein
MALPSPRRHGRRTALPAVLPAVLPVYDPHRGALAENTHSAHVKVERRRSAAGARITLGWRAPRCL